MEYYGINDAARMIGVSERQVRTWISVGRLRTVVVASHQLTGRERPNRAAVMALSADQVQREISRRAKASQDKQELSQNVP